MNILAVIPARGGSKGVPGKNTRLLAGKPLIAYSIETARRATSITRTVVSTDDEGIASVARQCGGDVPFLRPAELALDTSGMTPVLAHALHWYEIEAGTCDALVLLQPTSPFRPPGLIDDAIERMRSQGSDMIVGLREVDQHPHWMKIIDDGFVKPYQTEPPLLPVRRQELPLVYAISGSIYIWKRAALLRREEGSGATQFPDERVSAVILSGIHTLDIDSDWDFRFAEFVAASTDDVL